LDDAWPLEEGAFLLAAEALGVATAAEVLVAGALAMVLKRKK
jgi:hypothetical protein